MNLTKDTRSRFLLWSFLAVFAVLSFLWLRQAERREAERMNPFLREIRLREKHSEEIYSASRETLAESISKSAPVTSSTNLWRKDSTRAAEMTDDEKADLAKKFYEQFRPAAERWFAAYENRTPFNLADVTLDKFHSTLGSHMFTFMIGEITLTFVTPRDPNQPAKVGYLMVRKAALDMNRVPDSGFAPNLNVPITSEDVIRMVKADSGVEFKPNEVLIKPTAKASALNGGAFVDLLPTGADPNNGLSYKISMVFDAEGKLVNYERDPFF